jgi:hypothetical protein
MNARGMQDEGIMRRERQEIHTSVANAKPKDTLLAMNTQQCSFSFHLPCASHNRIRRVHLANFKPGSVPSARLVSKCWSVPLTKTSSGSSSHLRMVSHNNPSGCTMSSAMTGVMLTDGNRSEKNRFVLDPKIAKSILRIHMRGVFILSVMLSVGATDARTCAYGESSAGGLVDPLG